MRSISLPLSAGHRLSGHHKRRVLCVFPRYAPSFGTFEHAYKLMPGVRAFMPPQGLLLVAAYLPQEWEVRFIDENLSPVTDQDYHWAEAVFISGMHVQRHAIEQINRRAQSFGCVTVLGGPSVSSCPSYYPEVDMLHVGEFGDATRELAQRLDEDCTRPAAQLVFTTGERLPVEQFPVPAYHLINMRRYFLGSIQYSSGCPFMCEFCDIPALYGRNPRIKNPQRILDELDAMIAGGLLTTVYFVDDNFIANPAATRELLPHLIKWQKAHGYPLNFACEATLNLAQMDDILAMMREAGFNTVFCGIETPEADALSFMRKKQNLRQPILDSVQTLNSYGMEVVSGIILGLDTDTPRTGQNIVDFIEVSRIPMLTINLLYALPKTALYERLEREGRLLDDPERASNVQYKMPYDQVLGMWRRTIEQAYEPQRLLARFESQTQQTFVNRVSRRNATPRQVAFGMNVISRVLWHVGARADYRKQFWQVGRPLLKQGRIEELTHIGIVSHHLIEFARSTRGRGEASFYSDPSRTSRWAEAG